MATESILSLGDVAGGYGAMTILNGPSFDMAAGAITTVIGPKGAGKSTAFKAIFGLLKPRSGSISERYVPQGRNIFSEMSVRHNLELGAVAAALARFPALAKKAESQASTLSGGEQKQLEIARGLLLDPKLILIDEPSIGPSPMMVEETFALLRATRDRGAAILLIEQNAKQAPQTSDFGLALELGQTRLRDRADAILADPRVTQLFLGGAST